MNLCSESHDEVCFEGRGCPACETIDDLQRVIIRLEDKVLDLESKLDEAQAEIHELETQSEEAQNK